MAEEFIGSIDLARADADGEAGCRPTIRLRVIEVVQPKPELGEQRKVGEVADVGAGLDGVRAVRHREVINVLITFLQPTLRAAEGPAMIEVRPVKSGELALR